MDENEEALVVYFWRVLFLMLEKSIGKRGKDVGRFFKCKRCRGGICFRVYRKE